MTLFLLIALYWQFCSATVNCRWRCYCFQWAVSKGSATQVSPWFHLWQMHHHYLTSWLSMAFHSEFPTHSFFVSVISVIPSGWSYAFAGPRSRHVWSWKLTRFPAYSAWAKRRDSPSDSTVAQLWVQADISRFELLVVYRLPLFQNGLTQCGFI